MRGIVRFGTLWIAALVPAAAIAQTSPFPAEMVVSVPEVDARSGPSENYYATSRLRFGERVTVIKEADKNQNWVAIAPPQGSFGWINAKYVRLAKDNPNVGYVDVPGSTSADVMAGSNLHSEPPNVRITQLSPGTIVRLVDRPLQVQTDTWYPIAPHSTEYRFIQVAALRPVSSASPSAAPLDWRMQQNVAASVHPNIARAEDLVRAGQIEPAKELFKSIANLATDVQTRTYALDRYNALARGNYVVGLPSTTQPLGGGQPPLTIPNNTQTAWNNVQRPVDGRSTSLLQPSGVPTLPSVAQTGANGVVTQPAQWSPYGILRQTAFQKDGQPVFALENQQGQTLVYVTTRPGFTLRDYVDKMLTVYGPIHYNAQDMPRMQFVLAQHVAAAN